MPVGLPPEDFAAAIFDVAREHLTFRGSVDTQPETVAVAELRGQKARLVHQLPDQHQPHPACWRQAGELLLDRRWRGLNSRMSAYSFVGDDHIDIVAGHAQRNLHVEPRPPLVAMFNSIDTCLAHGRLRIGDAFTGEAKLRKQPVDEPADTFLIAQLTWKQEIDGDDICVVHMKLLASLCGVAIGMLSAVLIIVGAYISISDRSATKQLRGGKIPSPSLSREARIAIKRERGLTYSSAFDLSLAAAFSSSAGLVLSQPWVVAARADMLAIKDKQCAAPGREAPMTSPAYIRHPCASYHLHPPAIRM